MVRQRQRPPVAFMSVFAAAVFMLVSSSHHIKSIPGNTDIEQSPHYENDPPHRNIVESIKESSAVDTSAVDTIQETIQESKARIASEVYVDKQSNGGTKYLTRSVMAEKGVEKSAVKKSKANHNIDQVEEQERVGEESKVEKMKVEHRVERAEEPKAAAFAAPQSLPFQPTVPNLGVLVDAGRHYFPLPWLKELVDYLHRLRFNLIHFRLTDDQAFNIRLKSHPYLAKPSPVIMNEEGRVYSVEELKELVAYAKERNISIMPEINVPGHAGGWAGQLLVPCANFICKKAFGIPLNVHHPQLMTVLKDVLREVRQIFSSPYIHLGGDEIHLSIDCFQEVNMAIPNFGVFEANLTHVVKELDVPLEHVVRWETSGGSDFGPRTGRIVQYWNSARYQRPIQQRSGTPYFCSEGLYFDTDRERGAFEIYSHTKDLTFLQTPPTAIIAGTFELSTKTWVDRNVLGRLVAVAMGAAQLQFRNQADLFSKYRHYCHMVGLDAKVCSANGFILTRQEQYMEKWKEDWTVFRQDTCERLVEEATVRVMQSQEGLKRNAIIDATDSFWDSFGLSNNVVANVSKGVSANPPRRIDHVGVILDLVNDTPVESSNQERMNKLRAIIDDMAKLGFNLLQLRLLTDFGMAIKLQSLPYLAHLPDKDALPWDVDSIQELVRYAQKRGIQVMPEISVITRGGGWANAGILAECPSVVCEQGHGIALDTTDHIAPIISAVIYELCQIFSSRYLHLGYDERQESIACYIEAGIDDPGLGVWEQRLQGILRLQEIPVEHVLRWENAEGIIHPHRAGSVTNYNGNKTSDGKDGPYFLSTELIDGLDAWKVYQRINSIVKQGPTGLMAFVPISEWHSYRERLLAFSMGEQYKDLDEPTFQSSFQKTCESFGYKRCSALDKNQVSRQTQEKAYQKRINQSCLSRTVPMTSFAPRKGVLVPE